MLATTEHLLRSVDTSGKANHLASNFFLVICKWTHQKHREDVKWELAASAYTKGKLTVCLTFHILHFSMFWKKIQIAFFLQSLSHIMKLYLVLKNNNNNKKVQFTHQTTLLITTPPL